MSVSLRASRTEIGAIASADDINSTLQGVVRNLSRWAVLTQSSGAYSVGTVVAVNNIGTAAATQVLIADATRNSLVFHNPGDTNALMLAPATASGGANITPSFTSRGGSFILAAHGFLLISGLDSQLAWNAIASTSGTTNPLTIGIS